MELSKVAAMHCSSARVCCIALADMQGTVAPPLQGCGYCRLCEHAAKRINTAASCMPLQYTRIYAGDRCCSMLATLACWLGGKPSRHAAWTEKQPGLPAGQTCMSHSNYLLTSKTIEFSASPASWGGWLQASRWAVHCNRQHRGQQFLQAHRLPLQPKKHVLTGGADASCAMLTSLCKLMTAGCGPGCLLLLLAGTAAAGACLLCWWWAGMGSGVR